MAQHDTDTILDEHDTKMLFVASTFGAKIVIAIMFNGNFWELLFAVNFYAKLCKYTLLGNLRFSWRDSEGWVREWDTGFLYPAL